MNVSNGTLTMFISVMSMLAIGYSYMTDKNNQEKKKGTVYTLLVIVAMAIISFLVGSFPID